MNITRTGKVQCGLLTELVVAVKETTGWHMLILLVLWLSDPSASASLDVAALAFYKSSELPCACWIKHQGNGKSGQEKVCSLGQVIQRK